MPFKSKEQMRACFAQHNPRWDCHAWAHETKNLKKLPQYKKTSSRRKKPRSGGINCAEAKTEVQRAKCACIKDYQRCMSLYDNPIKCGHTLQECLDALPGRMGGALIRPIILMPTIPHQNTRWMY
jgi:hypothetical protein